MYLHSYIHMFDLLIYVCMLFVCLLYPGFGGLDMGFQKGCYQQGPDSDSPGCC